MARTRRLLHVAASAAQPARDRRPRERTDLPRGRENVVERLHVFSAALAGDDLHWYWDTAISRAYPRRSMESEAVWVGRPAALLQSVLGR